MLGISDRTRRDPERSRTWVGLAPRDSVLLAHWMMAVRGEVVELHTHVPLGAVPEMFDDQDDPVVAQQIAACFPRRADVVALLGDGWWLVELKPDADHHALGQVLSYRVWWGELANMPELAVVAVVTDRMDPACRRAYDAYSVRVVLVGHVLEEGQRIKRVMQDVVLDVAPDQRSLSR